MLLDKQRERVNTGIIPNTRIGGTIPSELRRGHSPRNNTSKRASSGSAVRWVTSLFILIAIAGCVGMDKERVATGAASPVDKTAPHAIRDGRLRVLMRDLESLMFERMYTEPELDQRRRRYAKEIAKTALALERAASDIYPISDDMALDKQQRKVFLDLVEQLRAQALELHGQGMRNEFSALRPTLDRITRTCSTCHSRFRLRALQGPSR